MFKDLSDEMERGFDLIAERIHSVDERVEEANDKLTCVRRVKSMRKSYQAP
jgi:DNA-binding ferritin-like protein